MVSQNNYKGFYWNPKTAEIDLNALTNVQVVIHLAGASVAKKWTSSYKEEIIESRVLSTRLLYQTLQKNTHQVKQIVSILLRLIWIVIKFIVVYFCWC